MPGSTLTSRLFSKIDQSGECWLWTGSRYQNGYGKIYVGSEEGHPRFDRTHRAMYKVVHGEIPEGKYVLHTCDVRHCVKPDHLYLGTQSQNIQDMDTRGRRNIQNHARGTRHHAAKFTEQEVADIRASYTGKYGELAALARHFGTTPQAIRSIAKMYGWKHVIAVGNLLATVKVRLPKANGEHHSQAKLTEDDVRAIRARVKTGEVQRSIAAEYGISAASVSLIVARKTWQHII